MSEPLSDFIDAMAAAGCAPAKTADIKPGADGVLIRADDDKPGKKSLYYSLNDEATFGRWYSCRTGANDYWHKKADRKWTAEEKAAWKEKTEEQRKAADAAKDADYKRVAAEAKAVWDDAPECKDHPYLKAKGVTATGLRQDGDDLLVSMFNGAFQGFQRITPDGDKYFLKGAMKKGCYHPLTTAQEDKSIMLICEGFSTGASIREATGLPTIVAFDAGNLVSVGQYLRKKYPDARLIYCADNDTETKGNPGRKYAEQAAVKTDGFVIWPEFPDGVSGSDFNDLATTQGLDAVKERIEQLLTPAADEEPPPYDYEQPPYDLEHSYASDSNLLGDMGLPFKVLGYSKGLYYYYPFGLKQVVALSPGAHSMSNLLQLCSLSDWESVYTKCSPTQITLYAQDTLFAIARRKGTFTPNKIRGAGAWLDNGRVLLHCGDVIYVDGKVTVPEKIDGDYTYVSGPRIFTPSDKAMQNSESHALREVCEMLSWENKLSGSLLAGWLVIAQVCSMLKWRPHIYITGQAEAGKSTVVKKIVLPVLGKLALYAAGGTTEPRLRYDLGYDGRPLVYDEADAETLKDKTIMAEVLTLTRKASDGQPVGKLGQDLFIPQFCACFSGINPALKAHADESRIAMLVLKKNVGAGAREQYDKTLEKIAKTITPGFSERLLTRTSQNLQSLLDNIKTFEAAAQKIIKGARASDQIAPMLAGLYMLHSTGRISQEKAEEWISEQEWEFHTNIKDDPDPVRLLHQIATSLIRYSPDAGASKDVSVGELIVAALGKDDKINKEWASRTLKQHSILVSGINVFIGNRNKNLGKILRDTVWSNGESGWGRTLCDLPGAAKEGPKYFSPGDTQRGTRLSASLFYEGYLQPELGEEEDMPL